MASWEDRNEAREVMRDYREQVRVLRNGFPTSSESHAHWLTEQLNALTCPICGLRADYHTGRAH